MDLDIAGYKILNLSPMNVLMGKNGCGKSRMLRAIEQAMVRSPDFPHVRYLSPERGGTLEYNPGVEQSMNSNARWLADTRRGNRAEQFRLQSVTQFRKLEILTLRDIEKNSNLRLDLNYTFDKIVGQINEILYNIRIERAESGFEFLVRGSEEKLKPAEISSGEAEIVSLAIEVLVFEKEVEGKENCYLLMDEPDLHVHPDLQTKFARFLGAATNRAGFTVILATHSTAFLGALADNEDTSVEFMRGGETELSFEQVTRIHRAVLPVFGAHPLSSVFNEAPPLLVEGDDDERVWQQAVRSSAGRIRVYPVPVDGVGEMPPYERIVQDVAASVYDEGIAYSLRDRDDGAGDINDDLPLVRMCLSCRAIENLILTDDLLHLLGTDWQSLRSGIEVWLERNTDHPNHAAMKTFWDNGLNRKSADLKVLRNDLMGITGSSKPWEVAVGQAIAGAGRPSSPFNPVPNSIHEFLGEKVCATLLNREA